MLKDSTIEMTNTSLILSLSKLGALRRVIMDLIGIIFLTILISQFPFEDVFETNKYVILFFLPPLLMVPDFIKHLRRLIFGEKYCFDKRLNELSYNGKRRVLLPEIEAVLINYKIDNDSTEHYLDLQLQNEKDLRIRCFGSRKSLMNDGLVIAKFLKVRLIDNDPYGSEELWGAADGTPADIDHLNEHLNE